MIKVPPMLDAAADAVTIVAIKDCVTTSDPPIEPFRIFVLLRNFLARIPFK